MESRLEARIATLERSLRFAWATALSSLLGFVLLIATGASATPEDLVVHSLTVVDGAGTERIVLAAPIPGERISPSTGLIINDAAGVERFGVGVMDNGSMGMGFDAPPGVGDQRNRERLYLGVTPEGAGFLKLLDNETRVRVILASDPADGSTALNFLDWSVEPVRFVPLGLQEVQQLVAAAEEGS